MTATDEWTEQARDIMDWYHPSDDGNALRLVDKHEHVLRRVSDMRKRHHWDGRRWVVDHESRAIRK